jgi:hypothetical protein
MCASSRRGSFQRPELEASCQESKGNRRVLRHMKHEQVCTTASKCVPEVHRKQQERTYLYRPYTSLYHVKHFNIKI